jgi:phosphoribosylanthranilate isomerase
MALKTLVKVGSITNLSDARYCAGMGVDFLGFRVIDGQPGLISVKSFQEIRGWVTGPQIVAEIYGIENSEQLNVIQQQVHPDYLELSLNEYARIGTAITLPYILSVSVDEQIPPLSAKPAYLLTESIHPGLSKYIPEFEILVYVNSLEKLNSAISQTGVSGIALSGGSEIRPGLKDYEALAGILEALEED